MERNLIKSYAETKGYTPIDWYKELNELLLTGDELKLQYLCQHAFSWNTCAVGNQSYLVARWEYGTPINPILYKLGNDFTESIDSAYNTRAHSETSKAFIKAAIDILEQIETLAAELVE